MPTVDQALRFLVTCARSPIKREHSNYGYEIWIPRIARDYFVQEQDLHYHGYDNDPRIAALTPAFYDAAWELCRRGILRPTVTRTGAQATDDGASGDGFSVTEAGRQWLDESDGTTFIATDPSQTGAVLERFRSLLGDGYHQRAQEALKCYAGGAFLACCSMVGAATESAVLRLAIEKSGDENQTLKEYRSARGRQKIENQVLHGVSEPLLGQIKNALRLMSYWRDEAAHGTTSDITASEAYEATARLLHFVHVLKDNWENLLVDRTNQQAQS